MDKAMRPGDSLVSTISMPKNLMLHAQLRNKIERGVGDSSPIRTAAVLTCVVGISALLLCTDLDPHEKEPLLVNLVQVGIDLGGMVRAGHPGWTGWGGHDDGHYRRAVENAK